MTGDGSCLERMCEIIGGGEGDLVRSVMKSAREHALERVPRSEGAWLESVRGVSDAIFQAAYGIDDGYAEGPAHKDPIVAYGVVRARIHRDRGADPYAWTVLVRYFRRAYLDLLDASDLEGVELLVCHRFMHRVFDRFEAGFRQGYGTPLSVGDEDAAIPA